MTKPAEQSGRPHSDVGRLVVQQSEDRVDGKFIQMLQPGGGCCHDFAVLVFEQAGQDLGGTCVFDAAQRGCCRQPDPVVGVGERADDERVP